MSAYLQLLRVCVCLLLFSELKVIYCDSKHPEKIFMQIIHQYQPLQDQSCLWLSSSFPASMFFGLSLHWCDE